ncbi:uncharacterized conserved protein [Coriobacteriaceae bacterium EMTCatB1]|nr:uncharacterized conserved protein [Coriobacteriaceae bacterium EMTCatB1]
MIRRIKQTLGTVPLPTTRAALAFVLLSGVPLLAPGRGAWIAAAVVAACCAAAAAFDARLLPPRGAISVERALPDKLSIGVPNPVVLTLRNASARPARLLVRETPPAGFAGERLAGPVDVAAHGEAEVSLAFTPPSRGAFVFGDVGVRALGPLGIVFRQEAVPCAQRCSVYPDITAVRGYALLARRGKLHEIGIRAARLAGAGTEFESLREYQPGDSFRDIDWKATARRGRPMVRQHEPERSQTLVIALDAGRLMAARAGTLTKLDRAVNAALLLAYLGLEMGDHVGLLIFGRDVERFVSPRKGRRQFGVLLEALYDAQPRIEEPDYERALRYLAQNLSRRSLVVLFTDVAGAEPSKRLLTVLSGLAPRHLALVATQRNRALEERAIADVTTVEDAFAAAVAEDLLRDKAEALRMLASRGALVLDVDPDDLSVAAVNRYLEIKARGQL